MQSAASRVASAPPTRSRLRSRLILANESRTGPAFFVLGSFWWCTNQKFALAVGLVSICKCIGYYPRWGRFPGPKTIETRAERNGPGLFRGPSALGGWWFWFLPCPRLKIGILPYRTKNEKCKMQDGQWAMGNRQCKVFVNNGKALFSSRQKKQKNRKRCDYALRRADASDPCSALITE